MPLTLLELHTAIAEHCAEIAELFKPGALVSVVVRNPHLADGDVFVSEDSIPEIKQALDRLAVKAERKLPA